MVIPCLGLSLDAVAVGMVGKAILIGVHFERLRGGNFWEELGLFRSNSGFGWRLVEFGSGLRLGRLVRLEAREGRDAGNGTLPGAAPPLDHGLRGTCEIFLLESPERFFWKTAGFQVVGGWWAGFASRAEAEGF